MYYLTNFHAIEERIKSGRTCGPLFMAKPGPRARELVTLASANKIRVERTGTFDLDKLAPDNRGIALQADDFLSDSAEMNLDTFLANLGERKNALVIILDEITDPHNYGAILRSCDQFGVDLLISAKRRSAKNADVVSKTSAGAVSWVSQTETPNLVRAAGDLKTAGFWVYGADTEGEAAYTKDLRGRTAIVLGSEGSGISRLLRESCDAMIAIPSFGKIDSLNVSVAAGVLLYEVQRQYYHPLA
jgi:23S rRNA (guanosine2251-2'-O)-methyltransferase